MTPDGFGPGDPGAAVRRVARRRGAGIAVVPLIALAALATGCGSSQSTSTASSSVPTASPTSTTVDQARPNVSFEVPIGVTPTGTRQLTIKTLAELPPSHRAGGLGPRILGLSGTPVSDQLKATANDAAVFWTRVANGSKLKLPPSRVTIVDGTPGTCAGHQYTTDDPAQYCFSTNTALLTLGWFTKHIEPIGNAALAATVGEIYGFHVTNALGLEKLVGTGHVTENDVFKAAVCFSGAWLYTVYERNFFENGDLQALGNLFASYGDVHAARDYLSAFERGFQRGDPTGCPKFAEPHGL
jgi:hypothetical protein